MACGFTFQYLDTKYTPRYILILLKYFITPIIGLGIIILCTFTYSSIAHWLQNDYAYYKNTTVEVQYNNNQKMSNHNESQSWKEFFCELIPKTPTDRKVFVCIILEIAALLIFTFISLFTQSMESSGYIISYWISIIWITLTCAVRYVHTFYMIDKGMIFQLIIAILLVLLFFLNLFLIANDLSSRFTYFAVTCTSFYLVTVCAVLGFYIFVDMNFDLTCNFIILASISAVLIASWALYSAFIIGDLDYMISVIIVLCLLAYLIFLYSRWKSNE